jgi:hypothetical protein
MTRALPDEDRTFESLLKYFGNYVFKELEFTRKRLNSVHEGVDILHGHHKINELLVSFDLFVDCLYESVGRSEGRLDAWTYFV